MFTSLKNNPAVRWSLFRRLALGLAGLLASAVVAPAEPVISEFMASNATTLTDEDGSYPDWIEIYNPDSTPINLSGWYLTDNAKKKTKWPIPTVAVAPNDYLVVFASGKDRRDPTRPLHTNFKLDAGSSYLALIRPDGATAATEFAPSYPQQYADISYGVTQPTDGSAPQLGYLRNATPGEPNGDALILPETVTFSRTAGPFTGTFRLVLAGASGDEHIRYTITPPSSAGAAAPDPTAASSAYSGPITINATVVVRAEVFSADDKLHGLPATAQFVQLANSVSTFSSQLPVLVLDEHGAGDLIKDGIDHPAWFYLYAPGGAATFAASPSLATPTTMSVRGNFSANFPKSSYSLTLQTELGRDNPQPLLGLDNASDWALIGPWSTDRSYIRNAFVYALSNGMGRWAPRTKFVETFVNKDADGLTSTDYTGIALLTDRIKISPDRVNIASLGSSDVIAPAVTGGYVFKFDPLPDPTHYNFITDHGIPSQLAGESTALVIEIPNANDLNQPQRDYIHGYIQQAENALFATKASGYANRSYLDFIDLPSWVDHHLLEVFVGNVDALYHSEYFYKDRGGKIVSGPAWDFDGTMGDGDPRCEQWNTWDTTGGRDVWNYDWWGLLAHDPEFMQAWIDRWQALRRDQFSAENLGNLADSLAAEIGPDAAARDLARWPDNQSRFPGGYLGEVAHLKDWITNRAAWIDQQFVAAPTATDNGATVTFTAPSGAQLAYTLDGSDPRALRGDVAPNATITSAPLTVPADANVHVRSYRADLKDVFPGSPWSSAAGSANASPLAPKAKLINLSSRAVVGSGEDTLIAGVTVTDTLGKNYLARAAGPTLAAFGATNILPDPVLGVFRADGVEIFRNTGWSTGPDATKLPAVFHAVGAFPFAAGSADSALLAPLPAGGYTLHVSSATGQSGIGLVELYTVDDNGRTQNLSTRARVHSGDGALIGGFVVQGPAYKRMLIRATGPTLGLFGVGDALADPVLKVFSGQTIVATNDDWSSDNAAIVAAASHSVGAFALPDGSKDAALLVTLPPGAYTIEVSGKDGAEGVALLEIYEVP